MNIIKYKNNEIKYVVDRKKVKNVNIRLKNDGIVYISANKRVSDKCIENIIVEKAEWILKHQEAFSNKKRIKPMLREQQDKLYFLGKELKINLFKSSEEGVNIYDENINIYLKDKNDFARKQNIVEVWLSEIGKKLFEDISRHTYKKLKDYRISYPIIKVKNMKSKWGVCYVNRGIIVLNKLMVMLPVECIEYVILHEYAHFVHPNHSREFYIFIEKFMPDYKHRIQILKSFTIAK